MIKYLKKIKIWGELIMNFIIKNLSKSFDKKLVLSDVNFNFESGKIYGLLGRNGSGKTTFFNCVNNDLEPDTGKFFIQETTEEAKRELKPDDIGYVISTPTVPEFLTAREFLKFYIDVNAHRIKNVPDLDECFDIIGIDEYDRDRLLKDFSHGMKNKMQMLINIITKPAILLLDEPLTSLDVVVAEEMKQILRGLKNDSIVIFSTHILELALDLCDEIIILNHGTFELVDKSDLDNSNFKERIIEILKEAENA